MVTKQTEPGWRYDGEHINATEESIEEDNGLEADERTMKLLQSIANSIHPSIRMTIDYPSKYDDNKVPMLDLKMWITKVAGIWSIVYEHYEKKMATKAVIHAKSALPMKTKRTVLTQEMLRILLHCSRLLPWGYVCGHLNNFTLKMQYSGYNQTIRHDVAKSAFHAFQTMMENEEKGIRPINRPKTWKKKERMELKEKKKTDWYKQGGFDSVLFVPATPNGKLKHMYEEEIRRSGLRIKIVERT